MDFVEPRLVLGELALTPGAKVGDFGAGTGVFALLMAHAVGAEGRVYAFDIQKELLAHLTDEASRERLTNIETLWSNLEKPGGTKLADGVLDAALVANIMFQVEDRESFVREVVRTVKPGGKILVLDWSESFGGLGPQPESVVSLEKAQALFTRERCTLSRENKAGGHHYVAVFSKST